MQRLIKYVYLIFVFLPALFFISSGHVSAADKNIHHLVVFGDPHLPGKYLKEKEQVVQTINSWNDVDMVVAVGDINEDRGTADEYDAVKLFFSRLNKPLAPITGNHDFIYADSLNAKGKRFKGMAETRQIKHERFLNTFGLENVYYSRMLGKYRLIFLSLDASDYLAQISGKQLSWLRSELSNNRKQPTVIFCHAPLAGTLRSYNDKVNTANYTIQPENEIQLLLATNPQVFLWVSGHTHTSPKEESFSSAANLYQKQVTNIHNTDMNRETIWTNSLFLYIDKVVIRTYNHKKGAWLKEYERKVLAPVL